jgi:SAM-dependent methyltransferase
MFLGTECSDLVFVDADLEFDDDAILKLIKHNKDIVAGAYPYRKTDLDYPVKLLFNKDNNCKDEETGLVSVECATTGLMRINRRVFDKLLVSEDNKGIKQYFRTGIIYDTNDWYGEDAYFCKEWRLLGGEIWVEPNINFGHHGAYCFTGNFHEYLMGLRVGCKVFGESTTGIPGWMTQPELDRLSVLANQSQDVVEIGCWKGRSTRVLLENCKGDVYAVDHWKGNPGDATEIAATTQNIYNEFISNVEDFNNIRIMRGYSAKIVNKFEDKSVDMVFIDADHSYEACKADIEMWLPKCKKFICGHDYTNIFPGVIQAVNERFKKVNVTDSIWWVELEA